MMIWHLWVNILELLESIDIGQVTEIDYSRFLSSLHHIRNMVAFRDCLILVWKLCRHFVIISLTLFLFAEHESWINSLLQSLDRTLHLLDYFALLGQIWGPFEQRVLDPGDHFENLSMANVAWVWHHLSHLSGCIATWWSRGCIYRLKRCRWWWTVLLSSPEHLTVLAG